MPDLLDGVLRIFGHWQHIFGGLLAGALVTGTAIGLEVAFHRTMALRTAALLFCACFLADAGYLAWRESATPPTIAPHPVAVIAPPVPLPEPVTAAAVMTDEGFLRSRALTLSNEIMRFYINRDVMQPRALNTGAAGSPEWNAVEEARTDYRKETISEFQAKFGSDLLRLTGRLLELNLNTGGIEVMYQDLADPASIRTIATRLSDLSKQ